MSRKKIRVGLFFGGCSPEHEFSSQSASTILRELDPELFEVVPIYISLQGKWFIVDSKEGKRKPLLEFPFFHSNQRFIDVVYPMIGGRTGEDGVLQGFLEFSGYPYVGTGVLGSAIGMDKYIAKVFAEWAGVLVAPYLLIKEAQWKRSKAEVLDLVKQKIEPPLFVKAVNSGSSLGVYLVKNRGALPKAIEGAFRYCNRLIIESAIDAREISFGVFQQADGAIQISPPGEVQFKGDFLSSEVKSNAKKMARIQIPAKISRTQSQKGRTIVQKICDTLQCEAMARVDLFLDRKSGAFIFNEVNTLPGFTEGSLYPKLFQASGFSIRELLSHLIQASLVRYQKQKWKPPP